MANAALKKHNELAAVITDIACMSINLLSMRLPVEETAEMPYSRQYVLEQVIRLLNERI